MALNATFTADFSRWNESLRNAQVGLKSFEVSGKGVQQQLERMAKSFSGVEIKKQADLALAAVNAIGGASKLTEAEQRKVNATVTDAIAKYRALGQQAPAELLKLQAATATVQRQMENMSKSFSGVEIKKQADLAVASVKAIGGASRLTEQEQRKVNQIVTDAIAKYRALGQQAPAELRKLQAETANVVKSTGLLGTAAGKASALFAGAFTVGAVVNLSRKVLQLGGDMADMSAQTGIGVRALQEFKFAGGQVGVGLDQITSAINQMQNRIAEGDKSAVGALKRLNISMKEFKALKPEDQFAIVADAIGGIQDPAEKVRTAMDLMGKSGAQLLPVLTEGFNEAREAARRMGVVLDEETIRALDEMGDRLDALQGVYLAGFARLLVQIEPLLVALGSAALESGKWLKYLQDQFTLVLLGASRLTADLADLEVQMYELARAGNPVARMLGTFDEVITEARSRADAARLTVKFMADSMVRDATRSILALAKLGEVRGGGGPRVSGGAGAAPSDEEIKRFQKWRDEVTGAATEKALQQLAQDWGRLTESERASQPIRDRVMEQYEKLRVLLPKVGGALEDLRTANLKTLQPLEDLQRLFQSIASSAIPDANKMFIAGQAALDGFANNGHLVSRRLVDIAVQMKAVPAAIYTEQIQLASEASEDWGDTLFAASDALRLIADSTADTTIARIASVFARAASTLGGLVGLLKDYNQAVKDGSKSGQASAAIGMGATYAGIVLSIAKWLDDRELQKKIERVQREWLAMGFAISAEQARINATTRSFVTQFAESIESAGGVTAYNLGNVAKAFNDILRVAVEAENARKASVAAGNDVAVPRDGTGISTNIKDIAAEVEEIFPQMAQAIVESGSLANREILEIIQNVKSLGIESAAVTKFVSDQANKALGGLGQFVTTRGGIFDKLSEAQKKLAGLKRDATIDSKDIDPKDIAAATAEVAKLQQQLAAIPLTVAGAGAVGASLFAIFEELTSSGQPALEVLKQIDPLIGSLDKQLAAAGLSGGAAFDSLKSLAGLATDETFGPAFEAISGLGSALVGLNNAGLLNQEMFGGLAEEITATFDGLVAQGVDGEQAMRLIQPTLQDLWELQKDFGYAVDDSTQKMLDEAKAAGFVGDKYRTATEKMLLATERIADAVEGIARVIGVTAVDAVKDFGRAIDDLPDTVSVRGNVDWDVPEPPDGYGGGNYYPGGAERMPGAASGIYATGARGVATWFGEGGEPELGGPVSFMSKALAGAMASMGTGVVGEKNRTATELRMTNQATEFMARSFSYVTDEVDELTDAINNLPDPVITPTIKWPSLTPPGGWPEPPDSYRGTGSGGGDDAPGPGYAGGTPGLGFMDFGAGRQVTLHNREAVVPYERRGEAAAAWGGGGVPGTTYNVTFNVPQGAGPEWTRRVLLDIVKEAGRGGEVLSGARDLVRLTGAKV